jgi:ribonucleoside-diphosphate reductase alpha subunit
MYSGNNFWSFNKHYTSINSIQKTNTENMQSPIDMDYFVIKRDGTKAPVRFDAITDRNQTLCSAAYGRRLNYVLSKLAGITQKVVQQFKNGMTTYELDMLTVSICAAKSAYYPDYNDLAARILISNLQKTTPKTMEEMIENMRTFRSKNGKPNIRLRDEFIEVVKRAAPEIYRRIKDARDFKFTHFGVKTIKTSYLMRNIDHVESEEGKKLITVERPQFMYMRVALFLNVCQPDKKGHLAEDSVFRKRLERAFELYDLLSTHKISHASPTIFNAGTNFPQLSSCFLLKCDDDFDSIMKMISDAGTISKYAGGVGVGFDSIRSDGSLINSSGGLATGVTYPLLNIVNACQLYSRQGGGKRNGAFAGYLSLWHADAFEFIKAGRHVGVAKNAPDMKYALWISDLFMKITQKELDGDKNAIWYMFSPDVANILCETHGDEFEKHYWDLVEKKMYTKTTKPSVIWEEICKTIAQRGFPYLLYKDNINNRSNLSHVMTIPESNLCAEITIPCNSSEYGTCNLGALCLGSYVIYDATANNKGRVRIDFAELYRAATILTRSINNVIRMTYYPTPECKVSNDRCRPIAIGIMGLADVFAKFKYAFGDKEAIELDRAIQAVIYFAAMEESSRIGEKYGNYEYHEGSPAQKGILQPDMWVRDGLLDKDWETEVEKTTNGLITPGKLESLRAKVSKHLYNGYVTANMPTATTSQVCGQNECFEPFTHIIYTRKGKFGEELLLNRYFQQEMEEEGLWTEDIIHKIIHNGGTIQSIKEIPLDIRRRYRTSREYDQRILIKHAIARAPFVSQSQSLNQYIYDVSVKRILTNQMYAWKGGMTTGSYYTHTKPASGSIKSAKLEKNKANNTGNKNNETWKPDSFDLDPEDVCTSCVM